MSEFHCEIIIPKTTEQPDDVLTVGREFSLSCHGEWPEGFVFDNAKFKLEGNEKYLLKILKTEKMTNNDLKFLVTSYIPGQISIPHLIVSDDTHLIDLGDLSFQVTSVVVQENAQNAPPEPYGPMGPFVVPFPWILVNYLVLVTIVIFSGIGYKIFRKIKRKKLLKKMDIYDVGASPAAQYYQYFRKIQRELGRMESPQKVVLEKEKLQILDEIKLSLDVYIYRRFQIPTLYFSRQKILKDIQNESRELHQILKQFLKNFEREFKSAKKNVQRLEVKDLLQLLQSTQKVMDGVEKFDSQVKSKIQKKAGL